MQQCYIKENIRSDYIYLRDFHFYNCKIKETQDTKSQIKMKTGYQLIAYRINISSDSKIMSRTNETCIHFVPHYHTDNVFKQISI